MATHKEEEIIERERRDCSSFYCPFALSLSFPGLSNLISFSPENTGRKKEPNWLYDSLFITFEWTFKWLINDFND